MTTTIDERKDSYIDSDDDSYIQWMYPQAGACEHFKEIEV